MKTPALLLALALAATAAGSARAQNFVSAGVAVPGAAVIAQPAYPYGVNPAYAPPAYYGAPVVVASGAYVEYPAPVYPYPYYATPGIAVGVGYGWGGWGYGGGYYRGGYYGGGYGVRGGYERGGAYARGGYSRGGRR